MKENKTAWQQWGEFYDKNKWSFETYPLSRAQNTAMDLVKSPDDQQKRMAATVALAQKEQADEMIKLFKDFVKEVKPWESS